MKALITGISGFAGSHLAEYLLDQGMEVAGTVRPGEGTDNLGAVLSALHLFQADLLDSDRVVEVISEAAPDLIFHLAALSTVSGSWTDPEGTLTNNILGQLHLLQAVLAAQINPRILIVGSDEEYGLLSPDELPATEESPLRPINPYGVSKVAQDLMGYQYFISFGLPCVRVRPFNHIGPRQSDTFVTSAFARQIAEAEAGLGAPVIYVGNLEGYRDFSDVRNMVRGYHLALTKGRPGEVYNLGSGKMVQIQALLDFLVAQARVPLRVEQDPKRLRPSEVPGRVADCSKAKEELGWWPEIPLEQSLTDVLEYWRERLSRQASEESDKQ